MQRPASRCCVRSASKIVHACHRRAPLVAACCALVVAAAPRSGLPRANSLEHQHRPRRALRLADFAVPARPRPAFDEQFPGEDRPDRRGDRRTFRVRRPNRRAGSIKLGGQTRPAHRSVHLGHATRPAGRSSPAERAALSLHRPQELNHSHDQAGAGAAVARRHRVTDRNARGLFRLLDLGFYQRRREGETAGADGIAPAGDARPPASLSVLDGKSREPNWSEPVRRARAARQSASRAMVLTQPKLDLTAVEQGGAASGFIRESAQELGPDARQRLPRAPRPARCRCRTRSSPPSPRAPAFRASSRWCWSASCCSLALGSGRVVAGRADHACWSGLLLTRWAGPR